MILWAVYWVFLAVTWDIALYSLLALLLVFLQRPLKNPGLMLRVTRFPIMWAFFPWLTPTRILGDYIARQRRFALVVRKMNRSSSFINNIVSIVQCFAGVLMIASMFFNGATTDVTTAIASALLNWSIFLYYYLKDNDDRRWRWDESAPDPDEPGGNARQLFEKDIVTV